MASAQLTPRAAWGSTCVMTATILPLSPGVPQPLADGRRERSRSSRAKIVLAMLDLVARGDIAPSAARVADHAGVGLRTVFRHFDDMDSLYREMADRIEAEVRPLVSQPFLGATWREQLLELTDRRAQVFETILPHRISANIKRYQSAFLMADYVRWLKLERGRVEMLLPPHILADKIVLESLHVALSFQSWRLLRHDQGLPPKQAAMVTRHLVEAVIARVAE
ncbi:MAG: TetR/AcrR family transcriptional regulator [Sphingopyxis sp.]